VKFISFEAAFKKEQAQSLALKPGQALLGTVSLINQAKAMTIPNIALVQDGASFAAYTKEGDQLKRQTVVLGQRGPVRSEIKSGISAGSQIVLLPEVKDKDKSRVQEKNKDTQS